MAPVLAALESSGKTRNLLVHTGQHYDSGLSGDIFSDLRLRAPDFSLDVGSGSHAEQTAAVLVAFAKVLETTRPDVVVVSGDVNSTLACALAAVKMGIPVAHVESGLRSRDWSMPEEVNRVLTDRLSTLLFTHSPEARVNLLTEGIDGSRVHEVGNTMIDSLRQNESRARSRTAWLRYGVASKGYGLITLHRPSNVDEPARLLAIADALNEASARQPLIFPVHPRTLAKLQAGLRDPLAGSRVVRVAPVGYIDFLSLMVGARFVVTDSGGVQEETTALRVPCFTFRSTTERPITTLLGTNTLIGDSPSALRLVGSEIPPFTCEEIPGWDGRASQRVAQVLTRALLGDAPSTMNAAVTAGS